MPGLNLTRDEARERAELVSVDNYDVTLDLTTGDEVFRSTTIVTFSATPGASTFLDAITREVHEVTLNGRSLEASVIADGARISLDNLAAENTLVVIADAEYTNTGEGLHRFVDPVDGEVYVYTQFEVPDSRRVFAVFEQPDLKATFTFTVTAPAHWEVVSNSPTPEPEVSGESATWSFAPTARLSSYVTALVAGPYDVVRSELTSTDGRTIPLGIFVRKSLAEYLDADYLFDKTRQGFAYFESRFDYPYPFDKYDQLFVPEFNAGAMENAGCVTFTEAYIFRGKVTEATRERRVATILHELAHMWFGDLVTMKWWDGLWLNESFAEWAATMACVHATEWTEAWTTFQATEKSWAYRQDQLPSTHPISADMRDLDDVQVNFDGITYAKGGSVLKQLVAWVGEDAFFAGVAAYFKKHAFGNTEFSDLLVELEAASGRDLSNWAGLWLETSGVNTLRPRIETDATGHISAFTIEQSAIAEYPTLRPHRLAVGFYDASGSEIVRGHRVEIDVDGPVTAVPSLIGRKRPALVLLNDDDLAYAKIRLDDDSLAVALARLRDLSDPLARSLVWGAAWDATRDAEVSARDYVRLVLDNIAGETESTTLRITLAQLSTAARMYVTPEFRAATIETIGDELLALAQTAEAGSDAQFQLVTVFANLASTPAHAAALRALYDGSLELPGLALDTDLGWLLLEGLVLNGAATDDEIAAALEKDDTATGAQSAARARATVPTAEAKLAAFESVVSNGELPNLIVRQTGVGFSHVNDPAVLESTPERYFAVATELWENRSFSIASSILVGFYPAPLASRELVDATRAWLETAPEVPALRRLMIENLDPIERALRVQARDAQGTTPGI